jgi:hypothetical protein
MQRVVLPGDDADPVLPVNFAPHHDFLIMR